MEVRKRILKKLENRCQKATTKKYGRVWIAYFTARNSFRFGPYKFSKLPGLIIEVYDDKKDYWFSLYKFGKGNIFVNQLIWNHKQEFVQKQKIFDYKRKQIGDPIKIFRSYWGCRTRQLLVKKVLIKQRNTTRLNSN